MTDIDWSSIPAIEDAELGNGVDFDHTIANSTGHPYYIPTTPIEGVDRFLNELVRRGEKIVIHTSRADADKHKIEKWMRHYNLPFHDVACGKRLFRRYFDDKAVRFDGDWDKIIENL